MHKIEGVGGWWDMETYSPLEGVLVFPFFLLSTTMLLLLPVLLLLEMPEQWLQKRLAVVAMGLGVACLPVDEGVSGELSRCLLRPTACREIKWWKNAIAHSTCQDLPEKWTPRENSFPTLRDHSRRG